MKTALPNLLSTIRRGSAFWERVFPPTARARRLIRAAQARCLAALAAGVMLVGAAALAAPADYYTEPFRPRFHFTPERNWMNDPNGMVFYEGEYHLFYQYNPFGDKWGHMSWGHAVSSNLVHWEHRPVALAEADGVMIFSGSAVVDWQNTSSFGQDGKPPLVAIYTGHYTEKPLQNQQLAYSNDKGRTWTKYSGNPVLEIGAKDFRDPKVMWHVPMKRWIMTVAMPTEHKVRFYGSPNLKEWTLLSEFGRAGATGGVWECPDLFELPLEGSKEKRWVLIINLNPGGLAGGSGGQYFVGQFDGTRFVADKDSLGQPTPEFVPDGKIITDFEGETYGDWKVTGDAFGPGPARGNFSSQNSVAGYKGERLVNSFFNGDQTTGTLTSPEFEVTQPFLNFLVGGGAHKETRMDLWVDGKIVRTASGQDNERLAWRSWQVREFTGKQAKLQIVDDHQGGWGHINVDQIMLAEAPARSASESALWFDYGPDYYAAVSWSDIPKSDGRRLWLGWMSNWDYAQDVPTSPWRSAMSIPREVGLRKTADGIRLVQKPVREMEELREQHWKFSRGDIAGANEWVAKKEIQGAQLEIVVEIAAPSDGVQGLKVLQDGKEATVIGVNGTRGTVFVDRTQSGNVSFHPKFPGVYEAPLTSRKQPVKLHVFVDAGSVEVFVNDGEQVLTAVVFPAASSRGVEFFGPASGVKFDSINIWKLKSCW
jgi:sucrose-6-phosphate hydrolase SacC (GH32 family)